MKKILFSMTIMIVLVAGTYNLALADNGPHGGFTTPTTDLWWMPPCPYGVRGKITHDQHSNVV